MNRIKIKQGKGQRFKGSMFVCKEGHLHDNHIPCCQIVGVKADLIYDKFWEEDLPGILLFIPEVNRFNYKEECYLSENKVF